MKDLNGYLFAFLVVLSILESCQGEDLGAPHDSVKGVVSVIDSLSYNFGIPLYTADQGKIAWTEFNTQIRLFQSGDTRTVLKRIQNEKNPFLECLAEGTSGSFGVRMALFKTLFDSDILPETVSRRITGLRFGALGYSDKTLKVTILDVDGQKIAEENFQMEAYKFKTYQLAFSNPKAKEIVFSTNSNGSGDTERFGLDDVHLMTNDTQSFRPPTSDADILQWLKRSSFNFFDWNFRSVGDTKGIVSESYAESNIISLSGIGFSYAIYIVAANDGFIAPDVAKDRIRKMLQWQIEQNWFDGTGGWHGFPHHYFKPDGNYFYQDVSTIDWAMCAAGIRVAKQNYINDPEIVAMADELLSRPDWTKALAEGNKIAMGFNGANGAMNGYRWGLAFSEETELVYLEAVASGDLSTEIFSGIERIPKAGYYPSWFGAGFTYNWLQLWTGAIEPFNTNSIAAFNNDAATCLSVFNRPLMGLTACSTLKTVDANGFFIWSEYISNQGGSIHGASSSVIQISPAPYGAALALPFKRDEALLALREYVAMGHFHELLGLPDNVRIKNLKTGMDVAPNWDPFDINIGPIILAIEQSENNTIGLLYLKDADVFNSLQALTASWPN